LLLFVRRLDITVSGHRHPFCGTCRFTSFVRSYCNFLLSFSLRVMPLFCVRFFRFFVTVRSVLRQRISPGPDGGLRRRTALGRRRRWRRMTWRTAAGVNKKNRFLLIS
jgi:hypothetical protein